MIGRGLSIAVTLIAIAARSMAVDAEEIRVLSPVAMRATMPQISAHFEAISGHKLAVEYATAGAIYERIKKGEVADAAIASTVHIDMLLSEGRIVAGSRSQFARVGVGVFVRNGAARPDLTSVDNFKRALLDATAIGYGDPAKGGVSGTAMAALVERLSIAAELRAKTRLFSDSQAVLTAVAAGDVVIGVGLTSDTVLAAGVELAGGLPPEVQTFTHYAGGVVYGSTHVDPASKFVAFLTSPSAKATFSAKGFEPQ